MGRLKQVNDITSGGNAEKNSKFIGRVMNDHGTAEGRTKFIEVPLEEITPRSINMYRQSRIEKLAKSIRNTNNRLIHPITLVRAADLPKENEMLQTFAHKGVDINQIKYIIVSGERRYRAFCLLRQEEKEKQKVKSGKSILGLDDINPFDTITACVLTPAEAKKEEIFYEDSNIESRQLTPIEAILHVKDVINEVTSPEEMRTALIEMNGGSEEGIPKAASEIKKKFRADKYCAYCLEKDLGIESVPPATIRGHLSILNNCSPKIVESLVAGTFPIREAKAITKFPKEIQEELLTLWESNIDSYRTKYNSLNNKGTTKEKRVSRIDARKQLKQMIAISKKYSKEMETLRTIAEQLGAFDREKLDSHISEYEKIVLQIEEITQKAIEDMK